VREDRGVATLDHCQVSITCGSNEEAVAIADVLVNERLAACAHLAPVASVYAWKAVVEHDDEVVLTVITRVERVDALAEVVRSMHTYELPAITWVALSGTAEYLAWVDAGTTAPPITPPTAPPITPPTAPPGVQRGT
jgi:periplasmic divalent cation tolerance protein